MRMAERPPNSPSEVGLFCRAEQLVTGLRSFLASYAERTGEASRTRAEQLEKAEKQHERVKREAQEELARRQRKAEAQLSEAMQRVEAQHGQQREQASQAWTSKQASELERHEGRADRIERKRREAVWLAETVLESARPKPQHEYAGIAKRVESGLKTIAEWRAFVDSLWPGVKARPGASERHDDGDNTRTVTAIDDFEAIVEDAEQSARSLDRALLPRVFRSGLQFLLVPAAGVAAAVGLGFGTDWQDPKLLTGVGLAGLILTAGLVLQLRRVAVRQFRAGVQRCETIAALAEASGAEVLSHAAQARDEAIAALTATCEADVGKAGAAATEAIELLQAERAVSEQAAKDQRTEETQALAAAELEAKEEIHQRVSEYRENAQQVFDAAIAAGQREYEEQIAASEQAFRNESAVLAGEWAEHQQRFAAESRSIIEAAGLASPTWRGRLDSSWTHPLPGLTAAQVGRVTFDIAALLEQTQLDAEHAAGFPAVLDLPVVVDMTARPSLLVEADSTRRHEGLDILQTSLLRLLASIPPGRAKLTIVDPVGRGRSFAGLMRLADHDESIVGSRIWTESRHIERRLTDLTEHIENVIQKYLRDDYATIDEYNRVAGEIAEPYRYLVIADFPHNFSEDAVARLASIVDAGPRCGVFVVMLTDPGAKQPAGFDLDAVRSGAVVLEPAATPEAFTVRSATLGDLPFTPDAAPEEADTVALLDRIGADAITASRVEVRYSVVEPPDGQRWTRSAADELRIPVGRAGATKAQEFRLGKGTSQHALIAGKTGSGKSTLLHVLTTAAMLWHDPGEVEFYLVDFKKGVEFKPYASGRLPHVRAVAIESDREFGLSVLQRLDTELRRRGDLFRDRGLQSLAQFRAKHPNEPMPRSVLIIDEFQEFFVEDDRIAQDASLLLDRLVRQGRAFGIHVLLASQTLSGAYTLSRSTVGQMAVRIAMKCSETDSYLILSEDNGAARLLSRPGEAIYNDANGLVEGNNPFQVAWLDDDQRDAVLRSVEGLAADRGVRFDEPVFFEGNAPAEIHRNGLLRRAVLERSRPIAPLAWLGEPVSIKEPTAAVMRRRGGANLLIVGQRSETAAAMLTSAVVGLAAQHEESGDRAAKFAVVDATPEDDPLAGRLASALAPLAHDVQAVSWRDAPEAVARFHAEMLAREDANRTDGPALYLVLHGLHWLRSLRRKEDDFSFSMDADAKGPAPDQQLRQLLIDGPRLGIFVMAWCDTTSSLTRALERSAIGEFGNRVLMQMSANDSSMLIESTSAARLGLHRAIFYDEERGAEEKFRPYGMPSADDVGRILSPPARQPGGA